MLGMPLPRNDLRVDFYGDAAGRELKLPQQFGHGYRPRQFARLIVDDDRHATVYCPGRLRAFHLPTSRMSVA